MSPGRGAGSPRPGLRLALTAAILAALLLGSVSSVITDKQQLLQGLNGQILATRTQLGVMLGQEQALERQIAALDGQLTQVAEQIQQETARLELLGLQVDAARVQLSEKEGELAQHLRDFGDRMRVMYKTGTVSGFELVLSAANFNDLLNRVFFFRDIVRDDRRQVEQLRLERAHIQALKAALEDQRAQQQQVVKSIQAQQAELQALRQQRVAAQAQVTALIASFQQQLQDMEAQRAAVAAQLQQLVAESLRARSSGHWVWPIDGVITQGFGCTSYPFEPYDPNCPFRHFHTGVDIANDSGTPVHAADGGIAHTYVMGCSWNPWLLCGFGRYVIVVHAGGFASLYGHLSGFAVADGTQINKDTVIGYVGSTGASTGPHLHFEIDVNGTPVDPMIYLPGP
ncbi:MAG TPA: peptidoglycan DD-metalloendopeptidase family protein [Candidatus Limnocylindrales bacterium]|nr:peptidoglycan DD-metalloendopeptidase family protein [Candidatus Limnocylindrales bacterium]